jgi:hypothetical protein
VSPQTLAHLFYPPNCSSRASDKYRCLIRAVRSYQCDTTADINQDGHYALAIHKNTRALYTLFPDTLCASGDEMAKVTVYKDLKAVSRWHRTNYLGAPGTTPNSLSHTFQEGPKMCLHGFVLSKEPSSPDGEPHRSLRQILGSDITAGMSSTVEIVKDKHGRDEVKTARSGPGLIFVKPSISAKYWQGRFAGCGLPASPGDGGTIGLMAEVLQLLQRHPKTKHLWLQVDGGGRYSARSCFNHFVMSHAFRKLNIGSLCLATSAANLSRFNDCEHLWSPTCKALGSVSFDHRSEHIPVLQAWRDLDAETYKCNCASIEQSIEQAIDGSVAKSKRGLKRHRVGTTRTLERYFQTEAEKTHREKKKRQADGNRHYRSCLRTDENRDLRHKARQLGSLFHGHIEAAKGLCDGGMKWSAGVEVKIQPLNPDAAFTDNPHVASLLGEDEGLEFLNEAHDLIGTGMIRKTLNARQRKILTLAKMYNDHMQRSRYFTFISVCEVEGCQFSEHCGPGSLEKFPLVRLIRKTGSRLFTPVPDSTQEKSFETILQILKKLSQDQKTFTATSPLPDQHLPSIQLVLGYRVPGFLDKGHHSCPYAHPRRIICGYFFFSQREANRHVRICHQDQLVVRRRSKDPAPVPSKPVASITKQTKCYGCDTDFQSAHYLQRHRKDNAKCQGFRKPRGRRPNSVKKQGLMKEHVQKQQQILDIKTQAVFEALQGELKSVQAAALLKEAQVQAAKAKAAAQKKAATTLKRAQRVAKRGRQKAHPKEIKGKSVSQKLRLAAAFKQSEARILANQLRKAKDLKIQQQGEACSLKDEQVREAKEKEIQELQAARALEAAAQPNITQLIMAKGAVDFQKLWAEPHKDNKRVRAMNRVGNVATVSKSVDLSAEKSVLPQLLQTSKQQSALVVKPKLTHIEQVAVEEEKLSYIDFDPALDGLTLEEAEEVSGVCEWRTVAGSQTQYLHSWYPMTFTESYYNSVVKESKKDEIESHYKDQDTGRIVVLWRKQWLNFEEGSQWFILERRGFIEKVLGKGTRARRNLFKVKFCADKKVYWECEAAVKAFLAKSASTIRTERKFFTYVLSQSVGSEFDAADPQESGALKKFEHALKLYEKKKKNVYWKFDYFSHLPISTVQYRHEFCGWLAKLHSRVKVPGDGNCLLWTSMVLYALSQDSRAYTQSVAIANKLRSGGVDTTGLRTVLVKAVGAINQGKNYLPFGLGPAAETELEELGRDGVFLPLTFFSVISLAIGKPILVFMQRSMHPAYPYCDEDKWDRKYTTCCVRYFGHPDKYKKTLAEYDIATCRVRFGPFGERSETPNHFDVLVASQLRFRKSHGLKTVTVERGVHHREYDSLKLKFERHLKQIQEVFRNQRVECNKRA